MDVDLNIDNYNFDDLLNLFGLKMKFSEDDLKKAKRSVLMTHPDKSGLDKQYFMFFTKYDNVILHPCCFFIKLVEQHRGIFFTKKRFKY